MEHWLMVKYRSNTLARLVVVTWLVIVDVSHISCQLYRPHLCTMTCAMTICDAYLFLPDTSILAGSKQSNTSNIVSVLYISVRWYTPLWYRNGIVNAECILEHRRILAKYRSDTVAKLVCGYMACYSGCSKYHVTVACKLIDLLPFLAILQPGFVRLGHRNSLRYV